jgi:cell division septum initiation protein DivIVA
LKKEQEQKLVNSIKKDKNRIVSDIRKKQRESKTIDKQIDRLIREAIAEANRKAALEKAKARALALKSNASLKSVAAVAKEPVSSSRIATPEDKLIG